MSKNKIYFDGLHVIQKNAKARLRELLELFPKMRAYVVYSSRWGQVEFGLPAEQSFLVFPMQFDLEDKTRDRLLANGQRSKYLSDPPKDPNRKISKEDRERMKLEGLALVKEIADSVLSAPLAIDLQVELRFHELDYDLISDLQRCPLVCHELTPVRRASIRIVLGTLESFGGG